jgi:hypothetical protein
LKRIFRPTIGILCALPLAAQTIATENYQGRTVAANSVMVKLHTNSQAAVDSLRQALNADSVRQVGGSSGPLLFHSQSQNATQLMMSLTGRIDLDYAEPDYVIKVAATPNDPSFSQLWGMTKISAPAAWDVATGSSSVVVGVVDSGINYNHPDLAANVWSAPAAFTVNLSSGAVTCPAGSHGYNAIAHSCDPMDDNGHGTHVSGTIGAVGNNNTGVAGVNWTTRLMGLKFLDSTGSGSVSNAIDAIDFAIQARSIFGANAPLRVLSNSWGGGGYSQALYNEIVLASSNDILFVAAAGNNGANDDNIPFYPASFNLSNMITVAATDTGDTLAGFSNFGKNSVHIAAPGVNILSTYQSGYAYLSGTSNATPHVSGAAALVAAVCGTNTAATKSVLLSHADAIAGLANNTVSGGRLNVNQAVRSCAPLVTMPVAPPSGPTGIWNGASVTPDLAWVQDSPVTVGVKFRADTGGTISGIRFYKGTGNNGIHTGLLYSSAGAVLGQAQFTAETGSGWQTVTFATPVAITANTTYIAAYWSTSGYADSRSFFTSRGADNAPLHALKSGVDGLNGVYAYGGSPTFPANSWQDSNYWVDVVFNPGGAVPVTLSLWNGPVAPDTAWVADMSPVTLGMKFRSDTTGSVTGIRFWKGSSGDNGTHIAVLYSSTGQVLAQAAFTGETASGWQTATFSAPVAIAANTTYIAACWTNSGYPVTRYFFTSQGVANGTLHALQSGVDGANSVYWYGSSPQFPSVSWQDSNYWIDVLVIPGQ